MMRRLVLVVAGLVLVGGAATATAPGSATYRQTDGPARFPARLVVRCDGWAEDSAARLVLVDYRPDRVVYRCHRP